MRKKLEIFLIKQQKTMNYVQNSLKFLIFEIKKKLENNELVCCEIYQPEIGQHLIYLKRPTDLENDLSAVSISFSEVRIDITYREKNKSKYYTGDELKIYKEFPDKNILFEIKEIEKYCYKQLKEIM